MRTFVGVVAHWWVVKSSDATPSHLRGEGMNTGYVRAKGHASRHLVPAFVYIRVIAVICVCMLCVCAVLSSLTDNRFRVLSEELSEYLPGNKDDRCPFVDK